MPTKYSTSAPTVGDPVVPGAHEESSNTHQKIHSNNQSRQPLPKTGEFYEDSQHRKYAVGDKVEYVPVGGPDSQTSRSTGRIERVLTTKTNAGDKNVRVNASEEEPQYEVRSTLRPRLENLKLGGVVGSERSVGSEVGEKRREGKMEGMGSRFREFLLELVQT